MGCQHGYKSSNIYNRTEKGCLCHDGSDLCMMTDKGSLAVTHNASKANGYWTLSGIPIANETITVGAESWTFKASRSGANEITIGTDASSTVDNIVSAINTDSTVVDAYDYGSVCVVEWATAGYIGNTKVIQEAATNVTVSGAYLTGGQDAGSGWVHEHFHPANSLHKGVSAAAEGVLNGMFYWVLSANNDYLYATTDINGDWDANQDVWATVTVSLHAAETANDCIRASILCDYFGDHENILTSKTQTVSIDHDIGNFNAEGDVHRLTFLINWDLADNVVHAGDYMNFRFWLDDVASPATVGSVKVHFMNVKYTTKYPNQPMISAIPASG